MVAGQFYRQLRAQLREAGIEDDAFEADLMLRHVTGKGHLQYGADEQLAEPQMQQLAELCRRRAARYPLQYLLGSWPFYGLQLAVGEGVLIPRQDTETVVEAALALLKDTPAPRVLDLCAGTGAIGLALAANLRGAKVTLVELSPEALRYCRKNANGRAQVMAADVLGFEASQPAGGYDCIVSNPPYVTQQEYEALAPERAFEPKQALVAPHEGLLFYEYITAHYRPLLAAGGWLVFEIGASQRAAVQALLHQNGYTAVGAAADLAGLDRCVWGQVPG